MRLSPAYLLIVAAPLPAAGRPLFDPATAAVEASAVTAVADGGRLRMTARPSESTPAVTVRAPAGHWDLSDVRFVELDLTNPGDTKVEFTCWALSPGGWGGASTYPTRPEGRLALEPGQGMTAKIDLRCRYPGPDVYTGVIDPARVSEVRIVFHPAGRQGDGYRNGGKLDLTTVRIGVDAPGPPPDASKRLIVPPVSAGGPAPGKRVRVVLAGYEGTDLSHVLYLPRDWTPTGRHPVIVEYPGNEYYWKYCHSTGRTEQGTIGYGMAKGERCVWLNLPFVSADGRREQVSGWGSPDRTAEYCLAAVRHACERYAGDPAAVVLTGFSRGGIACGYIGLRDDIIADMWLGFHSVDGGDGAPWNKAHLAVAERTARVKGRSSFVTKGRPWQDHLRAAGWPVEVADPNVGPDVHADGMLLEDRPSTLACRRWLDRLLTERPGTHALRGRVVGPNGIGKAGVRVAGGPTRFAVTDADGGYELPGLTDGPRTVTAGGQTRDITLSGRDVTGFDFILTGGAKP